MEFKTPFFFHVEVKVTQQLHPAGKTRQLGTDFVLDFVFPGFGLCTFAAAYYKSMYILSL